MPYNKKGALARYGKSGYYGSSTAKVASRALYLASNIAKQLNVEKKYLDTVQAQQIDKTTPSIHIVNAVPQGDTGESRDGDQVKAIRLYWNGTVSNDLPSSNNYPVMYRMVILLDKQSDGTPPTLAEIYQTTENPRSHLNMDNKMRFSILHDKQFLLTPAHINNNTKIVQGYMDLTKKFKKTAGLRIRYSGTGSTAADVASNPLYCIVFTSAGAVDNSTVNIYHRLRYVDN